MANSVVTQILADGPRNTIVKVTGLLDTSDLAVQDLVDPAARSSMRPGGPVGSNFNASQYAIKAIYWDVEDGLEVRLWWDATADVLAKVLVGREDMDYTQIGFLQNDAGAGKTGKVQISTEGWTAGTRSFTVIVHLIKQGSAA